MRIRLLMLLAIGVVACATRGTPSTEAPPSQRTSTHRRTNVISLEELDASAGFLSAGDAVRQLRPGWSHVNVWIRDQPFGTYDALTQIPINSVREITYLTKSEAQMKWGDRVNGNPVILVVLK